MASALSCSRLAAVAPARRARAARRAPCAPVAAWTPALSTADLEAKGGKAVVELGGAKILVAKEGDAIYAASNRCSHLGISLQGKTPLLQATVANGCVTCSAHGTVFDLKDGGKVKGEWCPKLPNLPIVGKGPKEKPLPVYPARVSEAGMIEVDV